MIITRSGAYWHLRFSAVGGKSFHFSLVNCFILSFRALRFGGEQTYCCPYFHISSYLFKVKAAFLFLTSLTCPVSWCHMVHYIFDFIQGWLGCIKLIHMSICSADDPLWLAERVGDIPSCSALHLSSTFTAAKLTINTELHNSSSHPPDSADLCCVFFPLQQWARQFWNKQSTEMSPDSTDS